MPYWGFGDRTLMNEIDFAKENREQIERAEKGGKGNRVSAIERFACCMLLKIIDC